jgi:hypothetical protein
VIPRVLRARLAGERGSVLITGLLLSLALIIVIGFAVDIGHAFLVKRQLAVNRLGRTISFDLSFSLYCRTSRKHSDPV